MKYFFLITCCSILLSSCKQNTRKDTTKTFFLKEIKRDSANIRAIIAVDSTTLYYAGSQGRFGYTKNQGKTWTVNPITYQDTILPEFRSIAKNKTAVYVLSVGNPALLYKLENNKHTLVYKEEHDKVFYDALAFFSDGIHGIAVGDPTDECPSIILTSDGGNSWSKLPCSKLPSFEDGEAFFAASNTNIKIIDSTVWIASGGKKARVLKSTDKGQTWEIYDTPIIQGEGSQGIYSIDFYDELNGFIIGGDYSKPLDNCKNKAVTTNGGQSWKIVANNVNPNYKSCVQYIPNSNGKELVAIGKTGVSYSKDGGSSWTEVSKDAYYTIQFTNDYSAWLAGHQKIGQLTIK